VLPELRATLDQSDMNFRVLLKVIIMKKPLIIGLVALPLVSDYLPVASRRSKLAKRFKLHYC
jgi:hypothetical protein